MGATNIATGLLATMLLIQGAFILDGDATASAAGDASGSCLHDGELTTFQTCFKAGMPRRDDGGYQVPSKPQVEAWQTVVTGIMTSGCTQTSVPAALAGLVDVATLRFASTTPFCAAAPTLATNGDNTNGWAAFLWNPAAVRDVHLHIPHPLYDSGTYEQGLDVFAQGELRSITIAGSHRYAMPKAGKYSASDMAHQTNSLFHAAVEQVLDTSPGLDTTHIQLHGMGATTCPVDIYLSEGKRSSPSSDSAATRLQQALSTNQPSWLVTTYGDDPYCKLHGTTNKQGAVVRKAGAWFVHAEQKKAVRDADAWAEAIADARVGLPL